MAYTLILQNLASRKEYLVRGLQDSSETYLCYVFENFVMPEGAEEGESAEETEEPKAEEAEEAAEKPEETEEEKAPEKKTAAKKTAAKKPAKKTSKKTAKAADSDKHEETTGGGFTVKL